MTDQENTVVETEETEEKKAKVEKQDIIRGRMPLPLVYVIRFLDGKDSEGAVADRYRTTPGKVSDIRKNANFKYITLETKFSKEDIDKAVERTALLGDQESYVNDLLGQLEPATQADLDAANAERKAARKPKGKKGDKPKDPEPVAEVEADELGVESDDSAPEPAEDDQLTDDQLDALLTN